MRDVLLSSAILATGLALGCGASAPRATLTVEGRTGATTAGSAAPAAPTASSPGGHEPTAPFATTNLVGSFRGAPFEGKHAIGYPGAKGRFVVEVWETAISCADRKPARGRSVRLLFPTRQKGPRQPLPMYGVMLGERGLTAGNGEYGWGISEGTSAELVTDPKGAARGEARLAVDTPGPPSAATLNGTISFEVCPCTDKDCL